MDKNCTLKDYKFETVALHAGQEKPDGDFGARAVPIYATTSYVFKDTEEAAARFALSDGGHIYSRISNPTNDAFERRIAALEGGAGALATASGAAATEYAVRNIACAGDHIVSSNLIYGGTYNLFANTLRECGIETTFVPGYDIQAFDKAVKPATKAIFAESMSNPNCDIADTEALARVAHRRGIPLIIDNTLATPYLLRPIEYGADIVVHSATKFIGGHGGVVGGAIVDSGKFDWAKGGKFPGLAKPNPSYHGAVFTLVAGNTAYIAKARAVLMRDAGAVISPFHSFIFLQGLESLSLRVERHAYNAGRVVEYLSQHPKVKSVSHPVCPRHRDHALYKKYFPNGGGSIFTFEIAGGAEPAKKWIDSLRLFSHLANIADAKSLAIHPASTTHSQMTARERAAAGVSDGLIRLSVGVEHVEDIINDMEGAFKRLN